MKRKGSTCRQERRKIILVLPRKFGRESKADDQQTKYVPCTCENGGPVTWGRKWLSQETGKKIPYNK